MRKTCLPYHQPGMTRVMPLFCTPTPGVPAWRQVLAKHTLELRELRDELTDAFAYRKRAEPIVAKLEAGRWWHSMEGHHEAWRQYDRVLAEHEAHLRHCGVSDCSEESAGGA